MIQILFSLLSLFLFSCEEDNSSTGPEEDLIPFFQDLKFKVSKLSRNDILVMIQQMNLTITQ